MLSTFQRSLIGGMVAALGLAIPVFGQSPLTQPATGGLAGAGPFHLVSTHGAVGDGKTVNTAAIQKVIDAASAAGGGTVYFPAGRWLTGTLLLKNNVQLWLDNGAVLLGSTNIADYPHHQPAYRTYSDNYVRQALVYAEDAHHIGIVGRGIIDGQGADPVFAPIPGKDNGYRRRPYLVRLVTCSDVHVEGITLRNSPMWTQQYLGCDKVTITNVTVEANINANNDMIDIDGCRDVRMTGCTADTDDDAITLKSTGPKPCENVTISDCVVGSHCSALKFGTESTGGFRNITINNIVIRPSRFGLRGQHYAKGIGGIALEMVDGGILENVTISNVVIEGTRAPIFLRLGNRARKHVPDAPAPGMGKLRNVIISNVVANGCEKIGCPIAGLPDHPIENVTLRDIRISMAGGGTADDASREIAEKPGDYPECSMFGTLPAYGFYARHVKGLTLDNVQVTCEKPELRPILVCDDVRDLSVSRLRAQASETAENIIVLKNTSTAVITACVAPSSTGTFLTMLGDFSHVGLIGNDLTETKTPWRYKADSQKGDQFRAESNLLPRGSDEARSQDYAQQIEDLKRQIQHVRNELRRR